MSQECAANIYEAARSIFDGLKTICGHRAEDVAVMTAMRLVEHRPAGAAWDMIVQAAGAIPDPTGEIAMFVSDAITMDTNARERGDFASASERDMAIARALRGEMPGASPKMSKQEVVCLFHSFSCIFANPYGSNPRVVDSIARAIAALARCYDVRGLALIWAAHGCDLQQCAAPDLVREMFIRALFQQPEFAPAQVRPGDW